MHTQADSGYSLNQNAKGSFR